MKIRLFFAIVLTTAALAACTTGGQDTQEPAPAPVESATPLPPSPEAVPTAATEPAPASRGRTAFKQLGISLQVPEGLDVIKDPIVNLDDPSKLQSYLFYIQNYGPEGGRAEVDFQMYGYLQYDLPRSDWEQYKNEILNSDMYEYAREIEINGLPGIDSQLGGQRNRFVYHFPLDGRILSIAVSDSTEENKALADEIISSLEYTPGSVTSASGVTLINEPSGYYQIYLPEEWQFGFNPPAGIRLSDLEASSPDAEVIIEDSEGPHSKIYFKQGLTLNVAVLDDASAMDGPARAEVISQSPIMIAGIAGNDYIFREPSTAEGEIREVRYYHNGLSYLVRFSYAPDADREEIDWLIRNLQIAP